MDLDVDESVTRFDLVPDNVVEAAKKVRAELGAKVPA